MYDNDFSEINELDDDYICHWGVKGMKWKDHVYKTGEDIKEGYKSAKRLAKKTYKTVKKKIGRIFETKAQKAARLKKEAEAKVRKARKKAIAPWSAKRKLEKEVPKALESAKKSMKRAASFTPIKRSINEAGKYITKKVTNNANAINEYSKNARQKGLNVSNTNMKVREFKDRQIAKQKQDEVRRKREQAAKVAKAQERARINVNSQQNFKAAERAAQKYKTQQDYSRTHGAGLEARQNKAINRIKLTQNTKNNLSAAERAAAKTQMERDRAAYEKQQKWKNRQMMKKYGGR